MSLENKIKRIIREETEDIDRKVLDFLRRRAIKSTYHHPDGYFSINHLSFKDTEYGFNDLQNKKDIVRKILNMLDEYNVVDLPEYDSNVLDEKRRKVVRTIRYFLNNVWNESK